MVDTILSSQSLFVIEQFAAESKIGETQKAKLIAVIESSPFLVTQFNKAANNGEHSLKSLTILNERAHLNAEAIFNHEDNSIGIRVNLSDEKAIDKLVYSLGHEIKHCLDDEKLDNLYKNFKNAIKARIDEDSRQGKLAFARDYTAELYQLQQAEKRMEGEADVSGFNALVSRIKHDAPNLSLKEVDKRIVRTKHGLEYIGNEKIKREPENGMIATHDSHLFTQTKRPTLTPDAIEANLDLASDRFWNRRPGEPENPNYTNEYGARALRKIYTLEADARQIPLTMNEKEFDISIQLDMARLGFKPEQIEAGLTIPRHISYRYTDLNYGFPRERIFNEPSSNHNHDNNKTINRQSSAQPDEASLSLDAITPKTRKLCTQIEEKLIEYCKRKNISADSPQDYRNIAWALTSRAISHKLFPMSRVESLCISKEGEIRIFSFEPDLRYIEMVANEAAVIPEKESLKEIIQFEQNKEMEAQRKVMEREQNQEIAGRSR